jgi:putative molybdopterin biosynthesis protein
MHVVESDQMQEAGDSKMKQMIYLEDVPLDRAQTIFNNALKSSGLWDPLPAENVGVVEAIGRVTAEPVWAKISAPHYNASAMDGYALRSKDTEGASETNPVSLYLVDPDLQVNEIDRPASVVDTGQPMPEWANAVVMIENTHSTSDSTGQPCIEIRAALPPWQNVRQLGEDMAATELVLPANHRLRPVDLGALAGSGHSTVSVFRKPRVAIIPTGSELVSVETASKTGVSPGQIIEYNSIVLGAQIHRWGGVPTRWPIISDDFEAIREAVQEAANEHDLVLINAGSSAGTRDYTATVVESLGKLLVHGVAVRPGHPVILGILGIEKRMSVNRDLTRYSGDLPPSVRDHQNRREDPLEASDSARNQVAFDGHDHSGSPPAFTQDDSRNSGIKESDVRVPVPVVGVPGYPVSAALTGEIFIEPLLARWQGLPGFQAPIMKATVTRKITSHTGDDDFVRVTIGKVRDRITATPISRGAGVITSLVRADGIVRIPRFSEGVDAGSKVDVYLYRTQAEIEQAIVVIGSHDLTLDLISQYLSKRGRGRRLSSANVGSLGGLIALRRGEAHLAGSHLLDPDTGDYNSSYIERYLTGQEIVLVTLAGREQGWIVPEGNPKQLRNWEDAANPDISLINRQRGAGTRVLLDYELEKRGIETHEIIGYDNEAFTHLAVAAAVSSGVADTGLGIAAAARALELDFVPLAHELYELVIPRDIFDSDHLRPLLDLLYEADFRSTVAALPGYDVRVMGDLRTVGD